MANFVVCITVVFRPDNKTDSKLPGAFAMSALKLYSQSNTHKIELLGKVCNTAEIEIVKSFYVLRIQHTSAKRKPQLGLIFSVTNFSTNFIRGHTLIKSGY